MQYLRGMLAHDMTPEAQGHGLWGKRHIFESVTYDSVSDCIIFRIRWEFIRCPDNVMWFNGKEVAMPRATYERTRVPVHTSMDIARYLRKDVPWDEQGGVSVAVFTHWETHNNIAYPVWEVQQ